MLSKIITRSVWKICLVFSLCGFSAFAQFTYNSSDVLLCFRDTVNKNYDLVVDCGPVSTFVNLPTGQKIYLTNYYNPALLTSYINPAFTGWAWTVCAANQNYPISDDMWLTRPRSTPSQQTSPWTTGNVNVNSPTAQQIDGGLADALSFTDSPYQTATAIVEPASNAHKILGGTANCYEYYLLSRTSGAANFGSFQGVVEQLNTATSPVRADFYQLLSTATTVNGTAGTYLGYFEISTNGAVVYTSGPAPVSVTAPQIVRIVKSGTTNTIYFTTVSGGTYNLIGTNILTAPRTNWPTIGTSVTGNGLTNSLQEISSSSPRYYSIRAQ